jgi:hypothetical protein
MAMPGCLACLAAPCRAGVWKCVCFPTSQNGILLGRNNAGNSGRANTREKKRMAFDWHGGEISNQTRIDPAYKNTQNVRRFLLLRCGPQFTFDRPLMAWIRDGVPKNMGDIADEWARRNAPPVSAS